MLDELQNPCTTKKGGVNMEKQIVESFYDRLCFALTAYEAVAENEDACDPEYDRGYALYEEVVDIVNDMAKAIN